HPGDGVRPAQPGGARHRGLHEGSRGVTRWLPAVVLVTSAALVTADEPPLPEVAAALARVKDRGSIELTTTGRHTGKPHTRPVWFVVSDAKVFLQAGHDGKTDWYRNLAKTPSVGLRSGTEKDVGARADDRRPGVLAHDETGERGRAEVGDRPGGYETRVGGDRAPRRERDAEAPHGLSPVQAKERVALVLGQERLPL